MTWAMFADPTVTVFSPLSGGIGLSLIVVAMGVVWRSVSVSRKIADTDRLTALARVKELEKERDEAYQERDNMRNELLRAVLDPEAWDPKNVDKMLLKLSGQKARDRKDE